MTENIELKPCPFCRAEPEYESNESNGYQFAKFTHESWCFFTAIGLQYDTVGEVLADTWNRRAHDRN